MLPLSLALSDVKRVSLYLDFLAIPLPYCDTQALSNCQEVGRNPASHTILGTSIEDAAKADNIFGILMGGEVPPRKAFIQAHATSVRNLDI